MAIIEIDKGSGFCFGVTTAIRKAEEELEKTGHLYCLGDIVHNTAEVDRLASRGLETITHEQLEQLHDVKVLLRAHGEPPETYELARRNHIEIIDATCPVVLQLQKRIKAQYMASPIPSKGDKASPCPSEGGEHLSVTSCAADTPPNHRKSPLRGTRSHTPCSGLRFS